MKQFSWKNLSDDARGILLVVVGVALMLHTSGIFTNLAYGVLLITSLLLIGQGAYELNLWDRIAKLLKFKKR